MFHELKTPQFGDSSEAYEGYLMVRAGSTLLVLPPESRMEVVEGKVKYLYSGNLDNLTCILICEAYLML